MSVQERETQPTEEKVYSLTDERRQQLIVEFGDMMGNQLYIYLSEVIAAVNDVKKVRELDAAFAEVIWNAIDFAQQTGDRISGIRAIRALQESNNIKAVMSELESYRHIQNVYKVLLSK
jgi:hypothetical protein